MSGWCPGSPFARLVGPLFTALPSARPVQGVGGPSPFPPSSGQPKGVCSRLHVPLYPVPISHTPPTRAHPTTPWRYTRDLVHHQAEIPQPWYFSATAPGAPQTFPYSSPSRPKGEFSVFVK